MTRRSMMMAGVMAAMLAVPAVAVAFGGPGGGPGGGGFGPCGGGSSGPMMGGAAGGPAVMQQALAATTVDLGRAIEAASRKVSDATLVSAKLVPFDLTQTQTRTPPATGNAFATPTPALAPTYIVTFRDASGAMTMVAVDGKTGAATQAGTATGAFAGRGPGGNAWGGRSGGSRMAPADLSGARIGPAEAIGKAVAAVPGGTGLPTLLRAVQQDTDTAWMVGVSQPAPAPSSATDPAGAPAQAMASVAPWTLVFVDPDSGEILSTRAMTPGLFGRHGGFGGGPGGGGRGW